MTGRKRATSGRFVVLCGPLFVGRSQFVDSVGLVGLMWSFEVSPDLSATIFDAQAFMSERDERQDHPDGSPAFFFRTPVRSFFSGLRPNDGTKPRARTRVLVYAYYVLIASLSY